MRRLEWQALAMLGQQGFQRSQLRAGAGGNHQLARLVTEDAAVAAHVQQRLGGLGRLAIKMFAIAARDAQPLAVGNCSLHRLGECGFGIGVRNVGQRIGGCG